MFRSFRPAGLEWLREEAALYKAAEQEADLYGKPMEFDDAARDRAMLEYVRAIANLDRSPIDATSDVRRQALEEGRSEREIALLQEGRHRMQKSIRLMAPYLLEVLAAGTGPEGMELRAADPAGG